MVKLRHAPVVVYESPNVNKNFVSPHSSLAVHDVIAIEDMNKVRRCAREGIVSNCKTVKSRRGLTPHAEVAIYTLSHPRNVRLHAHRGITCGS